MDQKLSEPTASMMSTAPLTQGAARRLTVPVGAGPAEVATRSATRETVVRHLWGITRLCMAWVFLWPFFDKMFGLGHQTTTAGAWINGGNPSKGFLSGSIGPFSGFYQSIAGAGWVNWLFMLGLLAIGVALLLGISMRFAAAAGSLLLILMWSASLPPADDVFMDNHLIYALLLVGLVFVGAGNTLGFGKRWTQTTLVKRHAWLG
jgi:thiosulfate dehydrogenase [quinone] large subunit